MMLRGNMRRKLSLYEEGRWWRRKRKECLFGESDCEWLVGSSDSPDSFSCIIKSF
jgi:hypothetical protein